LGKRHLEGFCCRAADGDKASVNLEQKMCNTLDQPAAPYITDVFGIDRELMCAEPK
jgi:hypothetical protein